MTQFIPAKPDDARLIAVMSKNLIEFGLPWSWNADRIMQRIHDPDSVVLTAREKEKLTGFAILHVGMERSHLHLLAVHLTFQRKGIGKGLINWLEETARTAGVFFVDLEVRAGNIGAISFYHKLGYRTKGLLPGYYNGRESAVRMTHDLRKCIPKTA
ncbi:MAG: GNAT family N-acetyltransferase [Gammaproteobacteria bacterium]|nr:GNAT family N-acetyltransferase [Gammaproteobacteria bacterium]